MFKKVGRALKGFGKKLSDGFKAVKGFGKKVGKGLEDLGIADVAREAAGTLAEAGREELARRGVNVAGAERLARQGMRFAEASPAMRREMGRGLVRQGAERGLGELRSRLGRR